MRTVFLPIVILSLLPAVLLGASPAGGETLSFESADYDNYAALYARAPKRAVTLTGDLSLPPNAAGPVPAVILMHAAGGRIAEQESYWVTALNRMPIAVLAVDSFGGRGLSGTVTVRDLPYASVVADIYGALRKLATDPRIDGKRVAVVGFSRGAEAARQAAFEPFRKGAMGNANLRLAAHVAFYPLCVTSADGADAFTGAPVLILGGEADDGTPVTNCRETITYFTAVAPQAPLRLIVYPNAHHGWDDPTKRGYYKNSPTSKNCIPLLLGTDGKIVAMVKNGKRVDLDRSMLRCPSAGATMWFDPTIRERSAADLGAFLRDVLFKP